MKEVPCRFGEGGRLAGIITRPDTPARRAALVLVSAGLSPKSGPFRLYVELARALSREGILTLRFDLGGIGDSRPDGTNDALEKRTGREIAEAVDYLTNNHELDDVVLGGLCSGAEDSFRGAEHDARITGVFMIDPFAYRTPGWRWRHWAYRATRRLLRALGLHRPFGSSPAVPMTGPKGRRPLVAYKYMDRSESSRILEAILKRRGHVHFLYTGGARELFNHEGQLKAMFPALEFGGLVTLDHVPHLEHTQLLQEDRRTLVDAIARRLTWAGQRDGEAKAPSGRELRINERSSSSLV
jgi:alpha-beta hydrolase superfamily lysophospholipase